jgi:predicted outer membrane protein
MQVRFAFGAATLGCGLAIALACGSGSVSAEPVGPAAATSAVAAASAGSVSPARAPAADASAATGTRGATDAGTDASAAAGTAACDLPRFSVASDGQIVAILMAESLAHVDVASAVRSRLVTASALDLAEKLITDDSVTEVMVLGETRETDVVPAPGGIDRAITAEASETIAALASTDGASVDTSYVDRELLAHLRALALLDRVLAPSAQDPRIADLVARVRDIVAQHAVAADQAREALEPCGSCPHIVE